MIDKNEVVDLTKKLIAIPSPYFEEKNIMAFIMNWFEQHYMQPSIHEYHENRITGHRGENVVLNLEGGLPGPTICLNGHLDTVRLCSGWTVDPYAGIVDGDKIYGLGALDMKSGCAATMVALRVFYSKYKSFRGRIIASYVSVEEGPYDAMGTNALIDDGFIRNIDFTIVTEPSTGFSRKQFPTVCLGARGGFGLEIELFGQASHAAQPRNGKSAALDASRVVCELENVDYVRDEHLGTGAACVVGLDSDGGACSVPDYARIKLFWHVVVGEDENTIRKEIEKAIERAQIQCEYKIKFREALSEGSRGFLPYIVSEDDPLVQTFMKSVADICGKEPEKAYFQSIGDFNYLDSRLNAPVMIFGADGDNYHSQNEYANITSIQKTSEVVYDFLEKILT